MLSSASIQAIHALAAMAWVGGIFFAFIALRPAADKTLEPPQKLALWHAAYSQFFPWVWIFIGLLLVTGYADLFMRFGGFSSGKTYLGFMHVIGLIMTAFFAYLYFGLYRALGRALEAKEIPTAAAVMKKMRPVMATNLTLGLVITAIGVSGSYF